MIKRAWRRFRQTPGFYAWLILGLWVVSLFFAPGVIFWWGDKRVCMILRMGNIHVACVKSGGGSIERPVAPALTVAFPHSTRPFTEGGRLALDVADSFPSTYPSGIDFDSLGLGIYHWRLYTRDDSSPVLWHYGWHVEISLIIPLIVAITYRVARRRKISARNDVREPQPL
jgi:hypothetical protein